MKSKVLHLLKSFKKLNFELHWKDKEGKFVACYGIIKIET